MENLIFSQLTYLVIFVILICLTERESMQTDPLNFNVFNIVFEVIRQVFVLHKILIICCITIIFSPANSFSYIYLQLYICSAYGNVGFSIGYSCERLLKIDQRISCNDASYGFVGKWSSKGKLVLIIVMIFGRLKKLICKEEKLGSSASM